MEGEWSFYRGAHFNGHMYILLYSIAMVKQWCFVSCIQYILPVNPHLPLPLQCFPPHWKILHTVADHLNMQGSGRTLCLQKQSKYVKAEKGNDVLTNVWESMSV